MPPPLPTSKQYPWSFRILRWIGAALIERTVWLFTAVIGSYVLGYAIAIMQPAGAPFPMLSIWIVVIGNAPFVLALFLLLTSPIWGRKWAPPGAECGRCGSKEAWIDEDEGNIVCVWCDD